MKLTLSQLNFKALKNLVFKKIESYKTSLILLQILTYL